MQVWQYQSPGGTSLSDLRFIHRRWKERGHESQHSNLPPSLQILHLLWFLIGLPSELRLWLVWSTPTPPPVWKLVSLDLFAFLSDCSMLEVMAGDFSGRSDSFGRFWFKIPFSEFEIRIKDTSYKTPVSECSTIRVTLNFGWMGVVYELLTLSWSLSLPWGPCS